jgi:predicted secreted hydrolase
MARLTLLALSILLLTGCGSEPAELAGIGPAGAMRFLSGNDGADYARVLTSRPFEFPQDHASHPEFRSEWWYFTGNLAGSDGRRFGFELTFFRFALAPEQPERKSVWGANQAWMAHLSLTDAAADRFVAAERFSREALGLAGSQLNPFTLRLEDWSIVSEGADLFPLRLTAGTAEGELSLTLTALKPPVSHGDDGLDRKGPETGNASHYYSFTRLQASGQIRVGQREDSVSGLAWMDREWGTSVLSRSLEGWDWFALQLSDGRDLMYYRLRSELGGSSPFSGGSLVAADGSRRALGPEDISLTVLEEWQSPTSGATYPVSWELIVPDEQLSLEIRPLIPQQELNLTVRYWEGAIVVAGVGQSRGVNGRGYLELTGY